MGDDYGYFGSGSSGYAHYQQTFKSCFGGSSGSDGGHHNNEPDWSSLLTLLKIGVLIVVPLYWTVTALHIAFYDMASIEPITILIDLFGTLAFQSGKISRNAFAPMTKVIKWMAGKIKDEENYRSRVSGMDAAVALQRKKTIKFLCIVDFSLSKQGIFFITLTQKPPFSP